MNYKDIKTNLPIVPIEDFNIKTAPLTLQIPSKLKMKPITSLSKLNIGAIMPEVETDPLSDLFPKSKVLDDEPIWRTYKDFSNDH